MKSVIHFTATFQPLPAECRSRIHRLDYYDGYPSPTAEARSSRLLKLLWGVTYPKVREANQRRYNALSSK